MNIAILTRFREGIYEGIWDGYACIIHKNYIELANRFGVGLTAIVTMHDFDKICEQCDGLIIPGSPFDIDPSYYGGQPFNPKNKFDEYALDSKVIEAFVKYNKPIFGICGGHQAINVFFGGTLAKVIDITHSDSKDSHYKKIATKDLLGNPVDYKTHNVTIEKDSFVYDVFESTRVAVNSYHNWAVDKLAPKFRAVAVTDDGIIEALECKEKNIFATQWHPELAAIRMGNNTEMKFFKNFLDTCAKVAIGK